MEYLNGKTWDEITREERFFCAELYNELKNDNQPFLKFLSKYDFDGNKKYEIGFEVCFYRDILNAYGMENDCFSPKRTFDLVLFSDREIHIFEAKSRQGFDNVQLNSIKKDPCEIKKLFEKINEEKKLAIKIPKVKIWAITSSEYTPKKETTSPFEKHIITWKEIYGVYKKDVFKHADNRK